MYRYLLYRMKRISLSELDRIIEQNMLNIDIQSQVKDNGEELDNLSKPAISFLDDEEKQEKTKVQDLQRAKSVIVDPFEKKSKDNAIKLSQQKISKINQTRSQLMNNQEELKKQSIQNQKDLEGQLNQLKQQAATLQKLKSNVQETFDKNFSLPILKRVGMPSINDFSNLEEQVPGQPAPAAPQPVKKSFKVMFEKSSGSPFEVFFSERGFRIGETRLSFETVEDAISKNFTITLDGGQGIVLDAVRMQKILKYKNHFA